MVRRLVLLVSAVLSVAAGAAMRSARMTWEEDVIATREWQEGVPVFPKREEAWQGVPEDFQGWLIVTHAWGVYPRERKRVKVRPRGSGWFHVVTSRSVATDMKRAGWEMLPGHEDLKITGNTVEQMAIYRKRVRAGRTETLKHFSETGVMFLVPERAR